jgi:hypothetical protein
MPMPDHRPPPDPADPKGLIRESFRIEGITASECRSIFVDWALSVAGDDPRLLIGQLLDRYRDEPADHPMRAVLTEGLSTPPKARRRGGRAARVSDT